MEGHKDDIEEQLLGELECPVCMEYMLPPIVLCESGHNICSECRPKLQNCPTCKREFLKTRNLSLEKFARKLECPCFFSKYGCHQAFPYDLVTLHQAICFYRHYACPLAGTPGVSCAWEGIHTEIRNHIKSLHKGKALFLNVCTAKNVFVKNFQAESVYQRVVFLENEIFYQAFEMRHGDFYFCLQYIGPEEFASNFHYEFSMNNTRRDENISVRLVPITIRDDILTTQINGNCVKMHCSFLKTFMENSEHLSFQFLIARVKESNFELKPSPQPLT